MTETPTTTQTTSDRNLSVLGGLRRDGVWNVARRILLVTLIGGMSLDLRDATFESDEVVITKVSLIGGVSVRIPAGVRVETTRFTLLGGSRVESDRSSVPVQHVVRIRSFGLLGGISVS